MRSSWMVMLMTFPLVLAACDALEAEGKADEGKKNAEVATFALG